MRRILLIGGSGRLGTAIRRRWLDCEVVAPPRNELPLERPLALQEALDAVRPSALVNAAAFHDVDRCELEPERAIEINALAVARAARLAFDRDVLFVTIGTDYVFDGRAARPYAEDDVPHPLSAYGLSKLAGEYLVERVHHNAFVVRTCGLYGERSAHGADRSVAARILAQARAGQPIRAVTDVVVSPTFAGDLADALRRLIESQQPGLYHAVNAGAVSWYDFVVELLRQAGVDCPVEPIAAAQWKAGAVRPHFSALANVRLGALGIEMPSWRDGIAAYLR